MFPVNIAKFLRIVFLWNNSGGCFWQSCRGTVKSAGCLFLDFAPPRAFDFDQKLTRNVTQIILYYDVTKQFLPCLNWSVTCFWFKNMFWKNISCFRFCWKTYTKPCTSNYLNPCVKRLFVSAFSSWSGAFNFRVWFGKWKNAM